VQKLKNASKLQSDGRSVSTNLKVGSPYCESRCCPIDLRTKRNKINVQEFMFYLLYAIDEFISFSSKRH
jgi:hypothetical protein